MSISVKNTVTYSRSTDPHLPQFATRVVLRWSHNHSLESIQELRYRDVGEVSRQRLLELLYEGHSAKSATQTLQLEIELQHGEEAQQILADRHHMPDYQYVYNLFKKTIQDRYGKIPDHLSYSQLSEDLKRLKELRKDTLKLDTWFDDTLFVAAVTTPLMERVNRLLPQAKDVVFMDNASGGGDKTHFRVYVLLTQSDVGGLPLGLFISSTASREAIGKGLQLLKDLLGNSAFYGQGTIGPSIFMTDNCDAQKGAIVDVFPRASHLICVVHILQAAWRNLWSRQFGVYKDDRAHLMKLLKDLVYAQSESAFDEKWEAILQDHTFNRYERVIQYLGSLWQKRFEWAVALRGDVKNRGCTTNNLAETAMIFLKGKVVCRQKDFNPVPLAESFATILSKWYSKRIFDHIAGATKKKMEKALTNAHGGAVSQQNVVKLDDDNFQVTGQDGKTEFVVNTSIGLCSCPIGTQGHICRHQFAVFNKFQQCYPFHFPLAENQGLRSLYLEIATGKRDITPAFLADVKIDLSVSEPLDDEIDEPEEFLLPSEPSANKVEEVCAGIAWLLEDFQTRLRQDPTALIAPFEKFLNTYQQALTSQTNDGLATALSTPPAELVKAISGAKVAKTASPKVKAKTVSSKEKAKAKSTASSSKGGSRKRKSSTPMKVGRPKKQKALPKIKIKLEKRPKE